MKKQIYLVLICFFAWGLFSSSHAKLTSWPHGLVKVCSTFTEEVGPVHNTICGAGFLISDSADKKLYVATSSHVSQGEKIRFHFSSHNESFTLGQVAHKFLADTINDVEVFQVRSKFQQNMALEPFTQIDSSRKKLVMVGDVELDLQISKACLNYIDSNHFIPFFPSHALSKYLELDNWEKRSSLPALHFGISTYGREIYTPSYIHNGMSGAPLVSKGLNPDAKGEVLGVARRRMRYEKMSFFTDAKRVIELINHVNSGKEGTLPYYNWSLKKLDFVFWSMKFGQLHRVWSSGGKEVEFYGINRKQKIDRSQHFLLASNMNSVRCGKNLNCGGTESVDGGGNESVDGGGTESVDGGGTESVDGGEFIQKISTGDLDRFIKSIIFGRPYHDKKIGNGESIDGSGPENLVTLIDEQSLTQFGLDVSLFKVLPKESLVGGKDGVSHLRTLVSGEKGSAFLSSGILWKSQDPEPAHEVIAFKLQKKKSSDCFRPNCYYVYANTPANWNFLALHGDRYEVIEAVDTKDLDLFDVIQNKFLNPKNVKSNLAEIKAGMRPEVSIPFGRPLPYGVNIQLSYGTASAAKFTIRNNFFNFKFSFFLKQNGGLKQNAIFTPYLAFSWGKKQTHFVFNLRELLFEDLTYLEFDDFSFDQVDAYLGQESTLIPEFSF